MQTQNTLSLVEQLRSVAQKWAAAQGSSLARIGKFVVNDGGFFTRLETQVQGTTTATLEKFAAFLVDAGNWPEGNVPVEAIEFGHRVGVTPLPAAASPDNPSEITPQGKAA